MRAVTVLVGFVRIGLRRQGIYDDIDGDSRPQGVGYDIGADEFVETSEILDLDITRFTATKMSRRSVVA